MKAAPHDTRRSLDLRRRSKITLPSQRPTRSRPTRAAIYVTRHNITSKMFRNYHKKKKKNRTNRQASTKNKSLSLSCRPRRTSSPSRATPTQSRPCCPNVWLSPAATLTHFRQHVAMKIKAQTLMRRRSLHSRTKQYKVY